MMTARTLNSPGAYTLKTQSAPNSASQDRLCHICGMTFSKVSLPAHQRACVKKSLKGKIGGNRAGITSSDGPMSTYPCASCYECIPHHKLSEHLRTCRGAVQRSSTASGKARGGSSQIVYAQKSSSAVSARDRRAALERANQAYRREYLQNDSFNVDQDREWSHPYDDARDTFEFETHAHGARAAAAAEHRSATSSRLLPKKTVMRQAAHLGSGSKNGSAQRRPAGDITDTGRWDIGDEYRSSRVHSEDRSTYRKTNAHDTFDRTPIVQRTQEPDLPDEGSLGDDNRIPCPSCGRKFLQEDRLEKHMEACAKMQKQRKIYDASKARVKGTEMEKYVGRPKAETASKEKNFSHDDIPIKTRKANWRTKHEKFIQMVRAARQPDDNTDKSKKGTSSRSFVPSEPDPDLVPCEYCGRRFNPDTAARHMPFCRDSKQKAQYRPMAKSQGAEHSAVTSKEDMLKKRTAYRPPLPKTKARSPKKA